MTHVNQRVLITAAANGIGLATAQAFAAAGASVFICDVDGTQLAETLMREPGLAGMPCDVGDEDQVSAFFEAGVKHLKGLDVLINCAGIGGPTALVEELTLQQWRHCLSVNLDGTFLCARQAAPILRRQRSGSIINFSSTAGLFGYARRSPYASAKWAVRGLTRSLAKELGPHGVRVNCICPGAVTGDRMDRVIAAQAAKENLSIDEVRAQIVDCSSLKTFIAPQDIASMALFLTSPAGARISGQDLVVDGYTETA